MKFSQSMVQPSVQTTVQSNIQTGHPDSMAKAYKPDLDSSLFALANVSAKLLKDVARENVPAPARDMSPEKQVPSVDLEISSEELNTPQ